MNDWLPQAWKRIFRFKSSTPAKGKARRTEPRKPLNFTLQVETLEARQLLSATNSFVDTSDRISPALMSLAANSNTTIVFNTNLTSTSNAITSANTVANTTYGVVSTIDSLIMRDNFGRVGVRITATNPSALVAPLQSMGFAISSVQQNLHFIEGFIVASKVPQLNNLAAQGLLGVIPMYKPVMAAGPTQNGADNALSADRVRETLPPGYDGTGVRIGVLSDSFNSGGASNLIGYTNGDLPSTVQVLQEGSAGASNEGRAMVELIHDIAPGASVSFATALFGEANFAQNIRDLANPTKGNASIIVDDVIYFNEPMFQDGIIAQAVNDVVNFNGVSYFSSAGNNGRNSFEIDTPTFSADPQFGAGNFLNFANGTTRNTITLNAGETLTLSLQWDDPYYTANGVDTDLDIFFIDSLTGQIITSSTSNNLATQTPSEIIGIGSGGTFSIDVMIRHDAGPLPGKIKWVDFGQHDDTFSVDTQSSTVYGHAAAARGLAVAAAPYFDSANVESFSSAGPTTILFTPTGSPLGAAQVRQTPAITALDGTNTSFFTGDIFFRGTDIEKDTYPNFFGTSAAAPHAAAVAALIRQANPGFTPQQVYDRLTSTAQDIGATGVDDVSGYGLIDAYRAIFGDAITASPNFVDSFEQGYMSQYWEVNNLGSGQTKVNGNSGAVEGTKSFTLQSSLSGVDAVSFSAFTNPLFYVAPNLTLNNGGFRTGSLSESILHMDLSGATEDVFLSFSAKQSFDPLVPSAQTAPGTSNNLQEPMSDIFLDREGSDGVAISTDGGNIWYKLVSLTGNMIGRSFQYHNINLSQIASEKGIALGSDVRIKFQQFDALGGAFDNGNGTFFSFFSPTTSFTPNGAFQVRTNAITIDNVQVFANQGPTVVINPAALTYNTGAPPLPIDSAALIIDNETPRFDGGQLIIAITGNGTVQDRLQIRNEGNLPNQISVVGNRVLFGGLEIGTFVGGSANAPLIITLNMNASPQLTQQLLRNITFNSTSASLLPRTITVTLSDGEGGTSSPASRVINVLPGANIAPVITLSPSSLTVQPGAAAIPIDGATVLTDPDSTNFASGVLTVKISANASSYDRIEIKNQGNASGQIGFSGSTIRYGGVIIGTLSGGSTNRTINLNTAATPTAIQALLRNITFRTTSSAATIGSRTVQFQITDGDGGTSAIASRTVNVARKNASPVIKGTTTAPNYFLGMNPVVIEPSASVTDSDSVNFAGGTFTVRITSNGTAFDKLSIRNQGSNVGQIAVSGGTNVLYGGILIGTVTGGNGNTSPLVITLNVNATPAATRALMRSITFQTTANTTATMKNRSITMQLTDGQGGVSNTLTKSVGVKR